MIRCFLTKALAALTAVFVLSAVSALPLTAHFPHSLTFCTAEAEGNGIPFDIRPAAAGDTAGNPNDASTPDTPLEEILPGDAEIPAVDEPLPDETPVPEAGTAPAPEAPAVDPLPEDNAVGDTDGNGRLEEGQAGGDENGHVGRDETPAETHPDTPAPDAQRPADSESGIGWGSVLVALLIAVALIVVIIALIPRRKSG